MDENKIGTSCGQQREIKDYKVAIKLSNIRNTLDFVSFCDALITEADVSEYKASIGVTTNAIFNNEDDLWFYDVDESISLIIDLNDLENLCYEFEEKVLSANTTNVCDTAWKAKGISAKQLLNFGVMQSKTQIVDAVK